MRRRVLRQIKNLMIFRGISGEVSYGGPMGLRMVRFLSETLRLEKIRPT